MASTTNLLLLRPGILHPVAAPQPRICPSVPPGQPLSEPFGRYGRRATLVATLPARARTRIASQHVPTPVTHYGGAGPATDPLRRL